MKMVNIDYCDSWGQYIMIDNVDENNYKNNRIKSPVMKKRNVMEKMEVIREVACEEYEKNDYSEYGDYYGEYGYNEKYGYTNINYDDDDEKYLINKRYKEEKNSYLANSTCCYVTGILCVGIISIPYYISNMFIN